MFINAEVEQHMNIYDEVLVVKGTLIADENRELYPSRITIKKNNIDFQLIDLCIQEKENGPFQSIKGMYHPIIEATIMDAAIELLGIKNLNSPLV